MFADNEPLLSCRLWVDATCQLVITNWPGKLQNPPVTRDLTRSSAILELLLLFHCCALLILWSCLKVTVSLWLNEICLYCWQTSKKTQTLNVALRTWRKRIKGSSFFFHWPLFIYDIAFSLWKKTLIEEETLSRFSTSFTVKVINWQSVTLSRQILSVWIGYSASARYLLNPQTKYL